MEQLIKKFELLPQPLSVKGINLRILWDPKKGDGEWIDQWAIGRSPNDKDPKGEILSDHAYEILLTFFCLENYRPRLPKARLSKMSPDELQNYPDKKIKASTSPYLRLVKD